MEHEFSLRAELDSAWAIRPLELKQYKGRTILVLEDPGGEPLDRLLGTPMELGKFLRVAIGASAALRPLHIRGLVHKDVKPANIMIEQSTGHAWLVGCGIASRLPWERQSPEPPEFIAGTLAYMAPEQTGRMNRSIDSRSDLYALGGSLYEALTGSLPFNASDSMEWVHCHIARQPVSPAERSSSVPVPVAAIIMKLLAKTAEDRYQTAAGVESDLRRCLAEWETQHRIDEFPLPEFSLTSKPLFAGCFLNPVSSLLRRLLDALHGVFCNDFGPMAGIFDARLRCMSYLLSGVLDEMSSLGCTLVNFVSSILAKRHSNTQNQ
jgi:serine/threonine protein kinase